MTQVPPTSTAGGADPSGAPPTEQHRYLIRAWGHEVATAVDGLRRGRWNGMKRWGLIFGLGVLFGLAGLTILYSVAAPRIGRGEVLDLPYAAIAAIILFAVPFATWLLKLVETEHSERRQLLREVEQAAARAEVLPDETSLDRLIAADVVLRRDLSYRGPQPCRDDAIRALAVVGALPGQVHADDDAAADTRQQTEYEAEDPDREPAPFVHEPPP